MGRNNCHIDLGSITTAGIYIAWALNDKLDWLEPYAGFTTLVTGWIAYSVQSGRNAIDKAMAKEEAEKTDRAHKKSLKDAN